ncbi:hypothetical protein [Gemmatimonas groenlandica]|uniref:Uncharacterized protein n=1 Tax=Gemmatimonas groenlandica TaxID=2732249 RepID=A0A6M4IS63_9BACT|nr:hypothetical protein [Gemmatimonas groenlandica]QJR36995.1 hypothetical protein HKW67_16450 [Gemmatimonas groenlandica]
MRTHIKVVGIVNLIYSAIGILAAAGVLLGGIFSSLATLNPIVLVVGTVTSALIAIVIGAISVFGLIAGFALLNHQQWARYVILFVSALRLFRWPWGTLFGGYSIWVLMHDETRQIFAMQS